MNVNRNTKRRIYNRGLYYFKEKLLCFCNSHYKYINILSCYKTFFKKFNNFILIYFCLAIRQSKFVLITLNNLLNDIRAINRITDS